MVTKLKVIYRTIIFATALVLAGGLAQDGFAASTLTIAPSSDGVYTLQGVGMDSVAAMDITVYYDTGSLKNPRVSQGSLISGAMMAVNDLTPGQVRMGIVRTTPVQGTGTIATITFDRSGSGGGTILSLSAKLSDIKGKAVSAQVQVSNASNTTAAASDQSTGTSAGSGASSTATATSGAATTGVPVPLVAPVPGQQKEQPVTIATTTGTEPEKTNEARSTAGSPESAGMTLSPDQTRNIAQNITVLERFREYRGERTVKALLALFEQSDAASGFRQEPKAVVSDGKATAKIIFTAKAAGGVTPAYALNSVRLISMKRDDERPDTWIAEVKPEKGVSSASIIVSRDGAMQEFLLTVAPKVASDPKAPGKFTEKAFSLYLSGKGRDLNNDGKRDYVDDYMYAVNYVAAHPVK